ncbi:MAG: response regulator transcription factor, partial [Blastocatellia bacterium]
MNNSGITILNVDGGEAGLCLKSRILREAGYRVVEAGTGADALRLIALESPQLVLLSVNLPDQSGIEVCRRIKTDPAPSSNSSSNTASTLVLLVSATFVGCERRARSLEEGADGYLLEPVTPEFLLANIKTLLRRSTGDTESERVLAGERRQAWALKKLAEAALAINSAGALDEILQLVTDHARELIGAHQAATGLTPDFPDTNAPGVNGGWLNAISLSEKYDQNLIDCNDGRVGTWVGSLVCRLNQPMRLTQADLESQRAWRDQTDARPYYPLGLAVLEGVATLREQATLRELAAVGEVAAFSRDTTPREMAALRMMATLRNPQILRGLEMRGWLAAPLTLRDGRNLGLIQLSDKYDGEFTEQD